MVGLRWWDPCFKLGLCSIKFRVTVRVIMVRVTLRVTVTVSNLQRGSEIWALP